MTTIQDVAKRAGVSVGTVSRVLNNHPAVRTGTRAAVLATIKELGYRPNALGRHLRAARTNAIAMLLPGLQQGMLAAISGAESVAGERGYELLIADTHLDDVRERQHIEALLGRRIDGLLTCPVGSVEAVAQVVLTSSTPTVLWAQPNQVMSLPAAIVDESGALDEAVRAAAMFGHESAGIAFAPAAGSSFAHTRNRGHRLLSALAKHGIGEIIELHFPTGDAGKQWDEFRTLLGSPHCPTVLFLGSHSMVPQAVQILREAGKRVPSDLSLVAFGDSEWSLAIDPPVSVIAVDLYEHIRQATQALFDRVAGQGARSVVTYSQFQFRGSLGPAPR